ncbi:MAG: class I adenylate-forming enzyme family protein [Candidatus Binataceae bacterium]
MHAESNPILNFIKKISQAFPGKTFLESIDQRTSITYRQLAALTAQIAGFLNEKKVRPNERVVLLANNSLEHLVTFLGVMAYGATICTVNTETTRGHLPEILSAAGPRLVLYERGLEVEDVARTSGAESIPLGQWRPDGATGFFSMLESQPRGREFAPVNGPRDDALIVYTSGTTSRPKGVVVDFSALCVNVEAIAETLDLNPDDRIVEFRSFNWISAQELSGLAPLFRGATLIMARKFSESRYFEWLQVHRATIGVCNPTCIAMLINRPAPMGRAGLPHLRFVTSSSAALPVEHWNRFEEIYGLPVAQGYGSSEALWIACSNERTRRVGSAGKPFPSQQLAIIDAEGAPLPPGEVGEVEVGGDPQTRYRYLRYDGTIETSTIGRIRPGDTGFIDRDGYLFLTGRTRELIIRGGVNISPVEIDNVLLQTPGVAEAAAVGVPDAIYGEEVVAYVVCKNGCDLDSAAILDACRSRLPAFRQPKEIIIMPGLPKNDRGKLDRKALAEDWKRRHPARQDR